MTNTTNAAAIESLRSFAAANNEIAFAHLCTAALAGEQWAVERVNLAMLNIGRLAMPGSASYDEAKLEIVSAAETDRPDGAIARKFEI